MRPMRLFGALAVALSIAAVGIVPAPAASAAPPAAVSAFGFAHNIGEPTLAVPGSRGSVSRIAVDETADQVFVPSQGARAIEVFAGDALAGDAPLATFAEPLGETSVAVDQSNGDVYVLNGFTSEFQKFTSNRAPVPVFAQDTSFSATPGEYAAGALAVDPTTGDVLVVETSVGRVSRFSSSGTPLSEFAAPHQPRELVVAGDGSIYLAQIEANNQAIVHYSAAGTELESYSVGTSKQLVGFTYDEDHETLILLMKSKTAVEFELRGVSLAGKELFSVPVPEGFPQQEPFGLALNRATGNLYVYFGASAGNEGGTLMLFEQAWRPGLEAPGVSAIMTTTAHFSAELDPGPGPPAGSEARFEYSADNGANWSATSYADDSSGRIEADIEGLEPNLRYLVRVRASNAKGSFVSQASSFVTQPVAPIVSTEPAEAIGETGATLAARINPMGLQTRYLFEYGPTAAYGSSVPFGPEAIAGAGHTGRLFQQVIGGLQPGTIYHYRVTATNSVGIGQGVDRTFTTQPAGSVQVRGYEQVTPVDHKFGQIAAGTGFFVGSSDDKVSYMLRTAGALGESTPAIGRAESVRDGNGWTTRVVDPPANVTGELIGRMVLAMSIDHKRDLIVTNRKLTPDAIETSEGANIYVNDLETGAKTLVASSPEIGAFNLLAGVTTQLSFISVAPDLSWVTFYSAVPLGGQTVPRGIYKWSESAGLELVSRLPDGTPTSVFSQSGATTADGERTYFATPSENVYTRFDGQTEALSLYLGEPGIPVEANLQGASKNGQFAFITSIYPLTPGAPEEFNATLVYRFDAATRKLEYLFQTAATGSPTRFEFFGASEDGNTLYYGDDEGAKEWRDGVITAAGPSTAIRSGVYMSSNGRYLAFPNKSANDGVEDLFLFDAASGETVCVTCVGGRLTEASLSLGDERWIAEPAPSPVSNDGRLFFTSSAALVPQDTNGTRDVYEYDAGHLTLISPGDAPFDATLGAVSPNQSNVYFTTAQPLVSQDTNQEVDVYDARVGGGFAAQNPAAPPKPCSGEACQAPASSRPPSATVGSEASSGTPRPKAKKSKKKSTKQCKKKGHRASCKKGKAKKGKASKKKGRSGGRTRGAGR